MTEAVSITGAKARLDIDKVEPASDPGRGYKPHGRLDTIDRSRVDNLPDEAKRIG